MLELYRWYLLGPGFRKLHGLPFRGISTDCGRFVVHGVSHGHVLFVVGSDELCGVRILCDWGCFQCQCDVLYIVPGRSFCSVSIDLRRLPRGLILGRSSHYMCQLPCRSLLFFSCSNLLRQLPRGLLRGRWLHELRIVCGGYLCGCRRVQQLRRVRPRPAPTRTRGFGLPAMPRGRRVRNLGLVLAHASLPAGLLCRFGGHLLRLLRGWPVRGGFWYGHLRSLRRGHGSGQHGFVLVRALRERDLPWRRELQLLRSGLVRRRGKFGMLHVRGGQIPGRI